MRIVLALLLVLIAYTPAFSGDVLVFGSTGERTSFVSLAVLKAAYAKYGIAVQGKTFPAGRALAEADAGKTDGEVNRIAAIENQHPELIRIPVPVNTFEALAYTCDESVEIDGWESLSKYRIGIRTGIRFMERATRDMPHVTSLKDESQLFDLLRNGRLDVVIDTALDAPMVMGNRSDCIRENRPALASMELYHYLHKRHLDLAPVITLILQSMEESGEIAAIRNRASREYRAHQLK